MRRQDEVEQAADLEIQNYQKQLKHDYRKNLDNQAQIKANEAVEKKRLEREQEMQNLRLL